MSDTIKWSFTADKCFRRCQRQFCLQHLVAWPTSSDPIRKEASLLKQLKTAELWQGNAIHRGIELFVVPAWQAGRMVSWERAIEETSEMAKRQFAFSAARRYREPGMTKTKAGDDYCALLLHETESNSVETPLNESLSVIETAFTNLSQMTELLSEISSTRRFWPELEVRVTYDAAAIVAHIDLLFFKEFGKPTIIDWKISESQGGSDADMQTALYGWALCQHPKWQVTKAEDCQLLEVQLLKQTVIEHRASQDDFDRLEDRVYRSVNRMKALISDESFDISLLDRYDFAANPNSCSYCPMRPLCQKLTIEPAPAPTLGSRSRTRKGKSNESPHPQLF